MFAKRTNWDLTLNPLAQAVAEHRAAGKPLIDLTVSNPTECGFEYDTEAILAALRDAESMKYEPNPKGLEAARLAIAGYYADRSEEVSIDDIFVTTSTSEGYSWLLRLLCDPDDEVLIPSPGYPLLDFLADLNDVRLARYPLFCDHRWQYDLHALEQATTPRTRAVVVVHPNNPTGNYCKPAERERLNEICARRGIAVIADEVFLDFAVDQAPRLSFVTSGRAAGEPLTFTLSGISKICGLPQMKVAWIAVAGPKSLKQEAIARLEVIADTYLSPNAPLQLALGKLLATRQAFQSQVMTRVRRNLSEIDGLLKNVTGWRRLETEAGWCTVLSRLTHREVASHSPESMVGRGALVHPGDFYGFPTVPGHLIVSLLGDPPTLRDGLAAMTELRRGSG